MKLSPKSLVRYSAVAVASVLVLSSCGRDDGEIVVSTNSSTRGLTVQATGIAMAVPDAVKMYLTVTVLADTSENALSEASAAADKVREALSNNGVDDKDITTQSVTVYPEYTYSQTGKSTLTGYRATQSFEVVVHEADTAGEVLDAVVAAGGDLVQVGGVSPIILETSAAAKKARADAIDNALAKAEDYAKLLGIELGSVEYINETSAPIGIGIMGRDVAVGTPEAATKIDLGEQQITVSVEIRWSLK
ncbi:MAG: SIMPL domain-containing protein [Ilumatobacteraceae bacterium]